MTPTIPGIHHITAIASDPQRNLNFYTQILGLHLVKLTVNYDAPDTHHFYLADGVGSPGTILTFFPWPNARRGMRGTGHVAGLAFYVRSGALGYWTNRLKGYTLEAATPFQRFDEEGISFMDPDGLQIEFIAAPAERTPDVIPWQGSPVPGEMALCGFHGVTLLERDIKPTSELLSKIFGFQPTHQSTDHVRYEASSDQPGRKIDVISQPASPTGRMGVGIVHHIAWRTPDDAGQLAWRNTLVERGLEVTEVIDRRYFHSIYFREPGGVLFEIATDPPGFTMDEEIDCLGTSLKLPPWLEPQRAAITSLLPGLQPPVLCPEPA